MPRDFALKFNNCSEILGKGPDRAPLHVGGSSMNRRALVTPTVSIKSDTCGADRR